MHLDCFDYFKQIMIINHEKLKISQRCSTFLYTAHTHSLLLLIVSVKQAHTCNCCIPRLHVLHILTQYSLNLFNGKIISKLKNNHTLDVFNMK